MASTTAARRRLFFVEPSKVDKYHITMIDGFIGSLLKSPAISKIFDLSCLLSESTHRNLSQAVRDAIQWRCIPVVNQDEHRVVFKSLVEFWVTLRVLFSLRPGDLALVSCITPTALVLLEIVNVVIRRRGMYVVIHGEIEGLIQNRDENWRKIGFWSQVWMKLRPRSSFIRIIVIDDFIRDALKSVAGGKLSDREIFVVHHPVTAIERREPVYDHPAVCFVGFRAAAKGFPVFEALSRRLSSVAFLAVGQGRVENVSTGEVSPLSDSQSFLGAISRCWVALFPYQGDYCATLSAAALDTLSAGVHIIATDRPFFVSLAEYFGPDFVTIFHGTAELDEYLKQPGWLADKMAGQAGRLEALSRSKYSLDKIRVELEQLVQGEGS